MITYPVPADSKWATYRLSTGQIVSRNQNWPVEGGGPIEGQDPDYVMLMHVSSAVPNYDSRLYYLHTVEIVDVDNNELRSTYSTVKRPVDEQKVAAENVEQEQLGLQLRLEREAVQTRLMVAAILNYIDGLVMPPKVQAMADEYKALGVKLWKNRDRLNEIFTQIDADQEPDLDSGWEPVP